MSILVDKFNLIAAAVSIIPCLFFVIKIESLMMRLERLIVSLPILFDNMTDVSELFNFLLVLVSAANFEFLICFDTNNVVAIVLSAIVES